MDMALKARVHHKINFKSPMMRDNLHKEYS